MKFLVDKKARLPNVPYLLLRDDNLSDSLFGQDVYQENLLEDMMMIQKKSLNKILRHDEIGNMHGKYIVESGVRFGGVLIRTMEFMLKNYKQ